MLKEKFTAYVDKKIKERKTKMEAKQNMTVMMTEEFAAALKDSDMVEVSNQIQ